MIKVHFFGGRWEGRVVVRFRTPSSLWFASGRYVLGIRDGALAYLWRG